jgi:hypothetical protein
VALVGLRGEIRIKLGADVVLPPLKNTEMSAAILSLVRKRIDEEMEFLICGIKENIAGAPFEELTRQLSCRAAKHTRSWFMKPVAGSRC